MYGERKPVGRSKGLLGNKWVQAAVVAELGVFFGTYAVYNRLGANPELRYWLYSEYPTVYRSYCDLITYTGFGQEQIKKDRDEFKFRDQVKRAKEKGQL